MKCEVIREGRACLEEAQFIVRTPWTTQLTCRDCSSAFKRYEMQRIDAFTCDWPVGGKECGELATHYYEGEGYQRPICYEHARLETNSRSVYLITNDSFDPKLVPHKPPVQPQPRVVLGGDKPGLFCHCGKSGKYRGGVETMPLCDEHVPQTTTPKTEPPSALITAPEDDVRAALKDLALSTIRILREKVEKWRTK